MASNPLEKYLSEKTAGLSGDLSGAVFAGASHVKPPASGWDQFLGAAGRKLSPKNLGGAAGGALATAGAAGAVGLVGLAAQKLVDAATKAHDFRSMLAFDANLAAKHEEDPRLVNQMFSTLRTFNPSFTKDPAVASSLVARMVDSPGGVSGMMGEVLPLRDKMRGQIGPAMMQGALGATRGGGSGGKHERGPSE
jgi:hypothetical protein